MSNEEDQKEVDSSSSEVKNIIVRQPVLPPAAPKRN